MIPGSLWMLAGNAAVLLWSWAILRRLHPNPGPLDPLVFLILRFALISLAVLASGLCGIMTSASLGLMGACSLALYFACNRFPKVRGLPWSRIGILAGLAASLVAIRLVLQAWFFSPYNLDVISYHVPKVAEWTSAGAITGETGIDPRSAFPAGFELIEIWWVVFLHHDVLIEMAGVEFLVLSFAGVYSLARTVRLEERPSFWAALLFILTPGLHLQATSCFNDGPVAALVVATAALLAARVHPAIVILAAGLGIGMKPTYAFAGPGLMLLGFLSREESPPPPLRPVLSWLAAAAGLFLGASWYVRNLVLYGNPIHPMSLQGLAHPTGTMAQQTGPRISSFLSNLRLLMDQRVYDPVPWAPQLDWIGGWGLAAFACGLPALLVFCREDGRFRRLAAGLSCSLGSVLLLVTTDAWFMRFVLFYPSLLCIGGMKLALRERPVKAVLVAAMLLQFAGTAFPDDLPVGGFTFFARQPWRERHLDLLPWAPKGNEPVVCTPGASYTYLLYRPDFSRRVLYARPATAGELLDFMDRHNARFIQGKGIPLIEDLVKRGKLRKMPGQFFERT